MILGLHDLNKASLSNAAIVVFGSLFFYYGNDIHIHINLPDQQCYKVYRDNEQQRKKIDAACKRRFKIEERVVDQDAEEKEKDSNHEGN